MAERPGIMLYFADWAAIQKRLNMAQRGELVSALMDFGKTGEIPTINNPMVEFVFSILSEKVLRDGERYRQRCIDNAYATYVRECKKKNILPLEQTEWFSKHAISCDIK